MLIDIRVRKCLHVQYTDMLFKKIVTIFLVNRDALLCVYKNDKFYACIDYKEFEQISSNDELFLYMENESVHEWVNELDMDQLGQLFKDHKNAVTILIEKPDFEKDTVLAVSREPVVFRSGYVDFSIYLTLKQKGIAAYIINFPIHIKNVYGTFGSINFTELYLRDLSLKNIFEKDVKKITDFLYDEFIENVLEKNQLERENYVSEGNRTIFLVGPCIVMGPYNSEIGLPDELNLLLKKDNYLYNIVNIDSRYFSKKILEVDICQNDIVLFIGYGLNYCDYDMTELYENYRGKRNLCTNLSLHVSKKGCELVANAIMEDIIIPQYEIANKINDKKVLHCAEKDQLPYELEYEIKLFLKRTGIPYFMRRGKNGAIVMNANPFTLGHRRLVEYASSQVDRLFVFVVEEDASFFTFEERLNMVHQGTKDIKNVVVMASGNYIISQKTFCGYFLKELDNTKIVDASQDIYIFARYVAPYFNINKRFVGDEPIDQITRQYNEQMKSILPDYGCKLIEIPRVKKDNIIISGSMVRKALLDKDFLFLKKMLPASSYLYIYDQRERFENRSINHQRRKKISLCMTDRFLQIWKIVQFIKEKRNVIIYGIGVYTKVVVNLLKEEEKEKLLYVDKKAEYLEMSFMGKKVLCPYQLKEEYLEYKIVILSPKYYKEIYFECMDMGIDRDRIRYNSYDLFSNAKIE